MDGQLQVARGVAIPLSEVELRTSRSSGPGGQHANVTASRVEAVFDVAASRSLSEEQKQRVMARLGPVVRATAQDTRSQTAQPRAGAGATALATRVGAGGPAAAAGDQADAAPRGAGAWTPSAGAASIKRARRRPEPEG